ncbi:Predicted nucleotide-binding protein containing TIR-like domain [Mycobacteroides abscessus subsp. massiliense]|uniref:TIR domain-containing protein n=2 Tax=Mycobacteroides abscessus TaxID=36809 RepID=UPI0009D1B396|nr:TIR domain-containing protein [Mycobacteroides abscessus]SLH93114.1 Predicted nucleotide-binding protein containing TIR-like domain [Mycobacteroides abscessus subsp. massiliense]SLI29956.1 Predicted nucleotide-binding protein containing TIR-like domain [Mycobacteroides abscessus subsp. massiliense]
MSAIDLGTALGISPGSSTIRTITAASSAFGLTGGSYKTVFSMKPLGQAISSPTEKGERERSLVTALMQVSLFKDIYELYKGKKKPERQYLVNTLVREFKVATKSAEAIADLFLENLRFVGLIKTTPGGEWITNDPTVISPPPAIEQQDDDDQDEDKGDVVPLGDAADETPVNPPPGGQRQKRPNKLFVGHGRNKKPLEQLTALLRDLNIPHLVAETEANAGRPISAKVRETMQQCGAAILIFSADVEYFDKDQNPVWRPSENVSHELGAASVMYDDRIIIFKEESVTLASNFSGIGYITFEKDKLDAQMNALLRELLKFQILKLSLGDE